MINVKSVLQQEVAANDEVARREWVESNATVEWDWDFVSWSKLRKHNALEKHGFTYGLMTSDLESCVSQGRGNQEDWKQ